MIPAEPFINVKPDKLQDKPLFLEIVNYPPGTYLL